MPWDYGKFILKQLDYPPSFSTSDTLSACRKLGLVVQLLNISVITIYILVYASINSKLQLPPPPRVKPGHLNFWRLDRSNSRFLGPKECSNGLCNRRIYLSGAVVGSCRLLWSLCINRPTHVSWPFTWLCCLLKQHFTIETMKNHLKLNKLPSWKMSIRKCKLL